MRLILKGNWTQLKDHMETADPTLHAWMPYLTATCKFLLRRNYHHLLYEVQLFMRVSDQKRPKKKGWFDRVR